MVSTLGGYINSGCGPGRYSSLTGRLPKDEDEFFRWVESKECQIQDLEEYISLHKETIFWSLNCSCHGLYSRVEITKFFLKIRPNDIAEGILRIFSEKEFLDPTYSESLNEILNTLSDQMSGRSDERAEYFKKTKLFLELYQRHPHLRRAYSRYESPEAQVVAFSSFESLSHIQRMDTPMWRCIDRHITPTGINWIYRLDGNFDQMTDSLRFWRSSCSRGRDDEVSKNWSSLNLYLFPAEIQASLPDENWWFSILGYEKQKGASGFFFTIPEPSAVLDRWNDLLRDSRARGIYRNLSIKIVREEASNKECIQAFLEHSILVSVGKPLPFIHNTLNRLIPEITAILSSTEETFNKSYEDGKQFVCNAMKAISRAQESGEDPELLHLMALCVGTFVDGFTFCDSLETRERLIISFYQKNYIAELLKSSPLEPWWEAFTKMGGATDKYTPDDVQNGWDRLVLPYLHVVLIGRIFVIVPFR